MSEQDDAAVREAAEAGDGEAMAHLARRLQVQARRLQAEARRWYGRSSGAGSLAGLHGLVGLAVADRDYDRARMYLAEAQERFPNAERRRYISVSPEVLGGDVSLDGDDVGEVRGAGVFTIVTPYAEQAAQALASVAPRLMDVDEYGEIQPPIEQRPDGIDAPYTPNYLAPIEFNSQAVVIGLDTKGVMWSAMGRTIVGILVDALAERRIPAHIVGECLDLRPELRPWTKSGTGETTRQSP